MIVKSNHKRRSGFTLLESVIALSILLVVFFFVFRAMSHILSAQNDTVKSQDLMAIGQYLNSQLDCPATLSEWNVCPSKRPITTYSDRGEVLTNTLGSKIQNFDIRAFCENRNIGFEFLDGIWGWKKFPLTVHCRSHLELLLDFEGNQVRDSSQNDFAVEFRQGVNPRNADFTFNSYNKAVPSFVNGAIGRAVSLNGSRGEHFVIPHHDNFLNDEYTVMAWVKLYPMSWNTDPIQLDLPNKYTNKRMWVLFSKDHNQIKNSGHIFVKFFEKLASEQAAYLATRYQNEIDLLQYSNFPNDLPSQYSTASDVKIDFMKWTHVAFTSSQNELAVYVNGVKVTSQVPDFVSIQEKQPGVSPPIPAETRFSGTQDQSCHVTACKSVPIDRCNLEENCVYHEGACHSYCYGNREPIVIGANTHRNAIEVPASYGPNIGDPQNLFLDEFFDGEIDQVSFWSRALEEEEINDIFINKRI